MARRRTNPDFLNGVPELLILRLLSQKPMYGYELVQNIKLLSSGQFEFGEGCVYPLLHRLEAEGALASRRENVAGRSRVVYRVSRTATRVSRKHRTVGPVWSAPCKWCCKEVPMAESNWLHEVQTALTTARLSHRYRCRLVEELRDHLEDLIEERESTMSTEALHDQSLHARLGTADDIVKSAKANLPTGAFARRHPIVTYLLAPLPLLIVLWIAYLAALIGIVTLFKPTVFEPWHARVAGVLISGLAYVPTLLVVLAITWIAVRSQSKVRWWLAGAAAGGFPVRLVGGFFSYAHRAGNGQSECGIFRPTWLGSVSPIRRTDADRYGVHGALPIQAKRDHDAAVGECLHERPARLPVKMESA